MLHISKQRFLKPARMVSPLLPLTLLLLLAAVGAAAYGLWVLLTPARDGALHRGARHARRARDLRELREPLPEAGRDRDLRRRPPALLAIPLVLVSLAPAGRRPLVALARPRQAPVARHPSNEAPLMRYRGRSRKGGPAHRPCSRFPPRGLPHRRRLRARAACARTALRPVRPAIPLPPPPKPIRRVPAGTLVAYVRSNRTVAVRSAPGGRVVARLSSRTEFGSPRTFAVTRAGHGLRVITTELPNGRTGWVDGHGALRGSAARPSASTSTSRAGCCAFASPAASPV